MFKITCLGDLLSADTAYTLKRGIGSKADTLAKYYSKSANTLFVDSDIVFCNLESPLISKSETGEKPFEGNPAIINLLKCLSINVVSLANNHITEFGEEGIGNTVRLLDKGSIKYTGILEKGQTKPAIIESAGIKIAICAFNEIEYRNGDGLLAPAQMQFMLDNIKQIRDKADIILFSMHWGDEYINYPSLSQIETAHSLIDNGVDVVIGHHPHVVQPVEQYKNGLIIYSLGNFMFDMFWSEKVRCGIQVDIQFFRDRKIEWEIKPFRIRKDYTHDFNVSAIPKKIYEEAERKYLSLLKEGNEKYNRTYMLEKRRVKRLARFRMKLYILFDFFKLSRASYKLLFSNIYCKVIQNWIKD